MEIAKTEAQEQQREKKMQIIVFRLGNEEYGLHIDEIKEVVITPSIAKIPLTPSYIKGVANIRGNILAIIDLEEKFGLGQADGLGVEKKANYSLVVESHEYKMAILVKEVPNTLSVTAAQIDTSPALVGQMEEDKNYIKGIIKLENRLVILLDIFKVISKREISQSILQQL
jgi:purine-binding chemotaxis protein CheW